jgi:hypothetical protein
MSSGLLVGFCSSSTFDASNLVWSTDGCDIFVDSVGSGQLFISIIPMCLVIFSILMFLWALNSVASLQVHVLQMMFC